MRLGLLIFFSILVNSLLLSAQERSTSIVFRNKQTGEERKINSGDYLKLSFLEGTVKKRYSGTFKEVNGEVLLLKGQRSVPMANILDISYRPQAARWPFWGLLIIGMLLGGFAFLLVFSEYVLATTVAKIALASVALSIVTSLSSVRQMHDINTQWTYEYYFPATPKQQMIPGP